MLRREGVQPPTNMYGLVERGWRVLERDSRKNNTPSQRSKTGQDGKANGNA